MTKGNKSVSHSVEMRRKTPRTVDLQPVTAAFLFPLLSGSPSRLNLSHCLFYGSVHSVQSLMDLFTNLFLFVILSLFKLHFIFNFTPSWGGLPPSPLTSPFSFMMYLAFKAFHCCIASLFVAKQVGKRCFLNTEYNFYMPSFHGV